MRDFLAWATSDERNELVFIFVGVLTLATICAVVAATVYLFANGLWAVALALWVGVPLYFLLTEYARHKKNKG